MAENKDNNYDIESNLLKNKKTNPNFDIEIIGTPVRFTIMLILNTHKNIPNAVLRKLIDISAGKLDHHIRILEKADYITKETKIFSNRPGSLIIITDKGKTAFIQYSRLLKDVLSDLEL